MIEKYTLQQMKEVKMTDEEKSLVWDGILLRVTDCLESEHQFSAESDRDSVLKRGGTFASQKIRSFSLMKKGKPPRNQNEKQELFLGYDLSLKDTKLILLILMIITIFFLLSPK